MVNHITQLEIDRYRQRVLSAADLLAVNNHLASCEECYQKFASSNLLGSTYRFVRADLEAAENENLEHYTFDQIAAYLDHELGAIDHEMVGLHLELCSDCQYLAEDLQQFKSELMRDRVGARIPSGSEQSEPSGFWARLRRVFAARFWHSPAYRIPVEGLILGTAATIVIWFVAAPLQKRAAILQEQVNQLQQRQQASPSDVASTAELRSQIEQLREENQALKSSSSSAAAKTSFRRDRQPSSQLLAVINDGGDRVTLDHRGNVQGVGFLSPEQRSIVSEALRAGSVRERPELSFPIETKGTAMGDHSESFALSSPVGIVLQTTQPTFRWQPLNGASAYTVTIYQSEPRPVTSSQPVTETEWTSPPLRGGRSYSWQVRAIKDNREIVSPSSVAPEARFFVLSQSQINELERAKRLYPKSHLTLGVLYARMGLKEEAAAEFRALLKINPDSPVVLQLLQSVTPKSQ